MCKFCIERTLSAKKSKSSIQRANSDKGIAFAKGETLSFTFLEGTEYQKNRVRAAFAEWLKVPNTLKVQEVRVGQKSDCRIGFADEGSWSFVGLDNRGISQNTKTLNIGWDDGPQHIATELHEVGHFFGFNHEHQNPIDNPLEWIIEKVVADVMRYGWTREDAIYQIIARHELAKINGTTFDWLSIMLYFFDGSWVKSGKGTPQNTVLSAMDKQHFTWLYGNGEVANEIIEKALLKALFREIFTERIDLQMMREENVVVIANKLGIPAKMADNKRTTVGLIWKELEN